MLSLPPVDVSIIVTCQDEQSQLRRLLPLLLSQSYEGEYEVIVVDKQGDKDVAEWLDGIAVDHPNLVHTFCPSTARGIDIHRLALTLGAKAASHEWLVFLSAGVGAPSGDWLTRLTASCGDDVDVVIGKTGRKRRWRWPSCNIFRHKFSIFQPTSSFILCRRNILFQEAPQIPRKRIIRLSL